MGVMSVVIEVSQFLWALIVISLLLFFVYLGYMMIKYGYVRPLTVGHSEPFAIYMEGYMEDFFAHYKKLEPGATKNAIEAFMRTHNTLFPDKHLQHDAEGFKPNDMPYFYAIYIFYSSIGTKETHELSMLDKFFERSLVNRFYEGGKQTLMDAVGKPMHSTKIDDITPLQQLRDAFNTMRDAIKTDAAFVKAQIDDNSKTKSNLDSVISVLLLDKMLNGYFDTILTGYNYRKSGGRSWTLFKLYMAEYSQFTFKEEIPGLWKTYGEEVKTLAKSWQAFLNSEEVSDFVTNLPLKIAGGETFAEEHGYKYEYKHDTEEHFASIIKAFIGIGKMIVMLFQIIEDPLSFFRWLFGLFIGIFIYILYIILLIVSYWVFYVIFGIWLIIVKAIFTLFWVALFILIAVIFIFLTIFDNLTGGMILPMFRCENLPDAWSKYPSFCRNNKYHRTAILCSSKCANRYFPSSWLCKKLPTSEPSYCPQQLIYNAYRSNLDPLDSAPFTYNYKPTLDYYTKYSHDQRKSLWRDIYEKRVEFKSACASAMEPYNDITRCMCNTIAKDAEFQEKHPEEYVKLMELCKLTYCSTPEDTRFSYCSTSGVNDDNAQKEKDIILKFTSYVIVFILFVMGGSVFASILENPEGLNER